MTHDLAARIADRLSTVYETPCRVTDLALLTGGASRETWRFTVTSRDRSDDLILRRDPPGAEEPERMRVEAAAFREAGRQGVPVPTIIDANADPDGIGPAYLIMSALQGEALPKKLLGDPQFSEIRPRLPYEMGRTLARIHRMDPAAVPGLADQDQLGALFDQYASTSPLPVLDLAFRWLTEHRPASERRTVVHGDFRNGNLMVSPTGIEGVLDWELTHLGDPLEDLGWLCARVWRFGAAGPVGGFGSREELVRGYADESGVSIDVADIEWWEIFAAVRWALICRQQADRAVTEGGEKTLELLAIGRRLTESEFDILDALGWSPVRRDLPPPASADDDLFGRPGIDELLSATREYIVALGERAGGADRYQSRVAAHVLSLAEREVRAGTVAREEHARLLAEAGFGSESDLALAIRSGAVDPARPDFAAVIRSAVEWRLAVANPRY